MTVAFMIVVWAVLLFGELKLAHKENKWVGLIIPGVSLLVSLLGPVAMYRFLITLPDAQPLFIEMMVTYMFLFSNIPTAIYLVIYIIGRLKMRKKEQLRKMDINGLE